MPFTTLRMVELRASQINGCSVSSTCTPVSCARPASPRSASPPWPRGGSSLVQRRRAGRLRPHRGGPPDRRPAGVDHRRDLGRRRRALRRGAARRPADRHRCHQRLEPPQRRHSARPPAPGRAAPARGRGRGSAALVDERPCKRAAQPNAGSCPTDDHHFVAFGVGDPPAILRLVEERATGCDGRGEAASVRGPTAPRARSGCGCAAGAAPSPKHRALGTPAPGSAAADRGCR